MAPITKLPSSSPSLSSSSSALEPGRRIIQPSAAASSVQGFYEPTESCLPHRMIINAWADEKCGKTHFGLTCPGPIAVINFDRRLDEVLRQFIGTKRIFVSDLRFSSEDANAVAVWKEFRASYKRALDSPVIKSIVIDTGTSVWELVRLAHFGKLAGNLPRYYEKPNADFENIVFDAMKTNKNLVVLHRTGDEYINEKTTGRQVRKGYKDIENLVQVNLLLKRDPKTREFQCVVYNNSLDAMKDGMVLEGPFCGVPFLGAELFGDSPDDWK